MIILLVACILSAILYRLGGMGGFKNAKLVRRLGCSLVFTLLVVILHHPATLWGWLALLATWGLSYGALTTYLDNIFGYDNYWAAGLLCGLAGLPLLVFCPWWIIGARLAINIVGQGFWSKIISWDIAEEAGRGIFFIL